MLQTSNLRNLPITGELFLFEGLQFFCGFHSKMLPTQSSVESLRILTTPILLSNCFSLVSPPPSAIAICCSSNLVSAMTPCKRMIWPTV